MNIEKIMPLSEHPRPDRVRETRLCLNGQWDFAFDEKGIALAKDKEGANWGYGNTVIDEEKFFERFEDIPMGFKRCEYFCGYCYTQLTDVFQEVNGLLDMDRNPKMDIERVRKINLKRR